MLDAASMIHAAFSDCKLIGSLPETLRAYALARCLEAARFLEMIPDAFGEYTDHGVIHSCTVLRLADKLRARNQLNEWEILIFILSAFHHDIGMAFLPEERGRLEEESRFKREYRHLKDLALPAARLVDGIPETVEAQIRTEYLRRHHGERCQEWIAQEYPPERSRSLVESIYVWDLVSRVCVGHTLDAQKLQGDPYPRSRPIGTLKSVDVKFLACLLRLADICHLSRDRALPHIRQAMEFKSDVSREIWEAVGEVAGVDCDENRGVITVAAQPRSFERHRMVSRFVEEIEVELRNVNRLLSSQDGDKYQFPWKLVDDSNVVAHPSATYIFEPNARFKLVQDKIVHLLMGSRLYADPLYALRELLQNAIDAIRLFKIRDRSAVGRVVVRYGLMTDGRAILEVFDNGTGMDREICLRHLLSVGARSFAWSERRYKDWGMPDGGLQLIAQHGIGFLSCFMLADRIEVFSKYPDAERIHLVLDSPTWLGEFKTTDASDFPQWDSAFRESTPWDERHGTCVRLHLRESVSKVSLMSFLSKNVLRVGERIVILYEGEKVELDEIWGATDQWPQGLAEEKSLEELKVLLSSARKDRSFFDGPPKDPAVQDLFEQVGDIRGIVRLKFAENYGSRLSQEGFLIRDGAGSLFGLNSSAREEGRYPFYFDLDVRRQACFELDAERARIIDREGILSCQLLDWIEERGLRSIQAIESPMFFPCGGVYYHGGSDLLVADDTQVVAFHQALREWYTPERMRRLLEDEKFKAFVEAKIFATIGNARNTPISIKEILGKEFFVLVPRVEFLCGGDFDLDLAGVSVRKEKDRGQAVANAVIQDLSREVGLDRVVFLPNFPQSFSLPLSVVFRFDWLEISPWVLLGRLIEKESWDVPQRDVIELKFEEVGGFIDSGHIMKSVSARARRRVRPK